MPLIKWNAKKQYDLQGRAEENAGDINNSSSPNNNNNSNNNAGGHHHHHHHHHHSTGDNENLYDDGKVFALSINPHQNSYIPDLNVTKSLPNDIIQLTRYQRRPTVHDTALQRKPSIRNIFLGVPNTERRRFSEDIRGPLLAAQARQNIRNKETTRVLLLQVFIPFLLSGFGNVAAGLFLNYAQTWRVFRENTIFYMLLATVMAFKTNLEATLAARLSTCSNMGTIKSPKEKFQAFLGNLALLQTQSVIFGCMAGLLVVAINTLQVGQFNFYLGVRVLATGMTSICINEIISSVIIMAVVVASEKANVNPDNVSTLIAAMLGDFSSVFFVSITAAWFHTIATYNWLYYTLILTLLFLLPMFIYVANKNSFTRGMFIETHIPLAMAVSVATMSGLVFDHAVEAFARIAIYQAVVNGVSVNLMAVQASRISTYFQQLSQVAPERAANDAGRCLQSPIRALYAKDMNASVSRWLILMCVPAVSVYLCSIFILCPSHVDITFYLVACCLLAAVTQVTFVQCLTYLVTPVTWKQRWDPDNCVIPILMSISDCFGNFILLTAFLFLKHMGDPNSIGHEPAHHGSSALIHTGGAGNEYLLEDSV